jgi:transposase
MMRRASTLWSQAGQQAIASLPLTPNAAHRRTQLHPMYRRLDRQIGTLDERVRDQALRRPGAKPLMTHPGVGTVTALATGVFLGDPARFADGKALASYVGTIPQRTFQRRAAAARQTEQTRQPAAALSLG